MGGFVIIWGIVGALVFATFLIPIIDIFRRRWRRRKIQTIAKAIGWQFKPIRQEPSNHPHSKIVEINVIEGCMGNISARVSDVPVKSEFVQKSKHLLRGSFDVSPPDTILFLEFQHEIIPEFSLRPRMWGDGFVKSEIIGKNFVVEGNDKEILLTLFDKNAIAHYEKQNDLYICVEGRTIKVQYCPDNYLPATKERYLDLIAEGKYIVELINQFIDENKVVRSATDEN